MKHALASSFAALFLVACTGTPDKPIEAKPFITQTDLDSCMRQPDQPWCAAECEHYDMEWCE